MGDFTAIDQLDGKRLATSYDGLLRGYLAERGINAKVVRLDGAVESSVRLGVADAIADVVETGTTLKAAGLEIFGEPILQSEAVLIGRKRQRRTAAAEVLIRRLQGVLVARQYVLMDYDIRNELRGAGRRADPGPRVADRVAAARLGLGRRAVDGARATDTNRIMDELYDLGARAILVTDIHACRL